MATQQKMTSTTAPAARDVKDQAIPAVRTSQQSSQMMPAQPQAAPIIPWGSDHPDNILAPFRSLFGGGFGLDPLIAYTAPVLNIFNREMSHLNTLARRAAALQPSLVVDVVEKEDELVVDAFIGAPKECVKLEYDSDHLYLSASRQDQTETTDGRFAYRRESWSGTSSRTVFVGQNFNLDQMTSSFIDGRLTVKIPRVGGSIRKQVTL